MKYDVLDRYTCIVRFTAEIECDDDTPTSFKLGLSVKWALKNGADLSWANLSGANLSEADLSGADLRGSNLRGSNLRWADLSWANLSWANLSRANLSGANLSRANLSRADLSWADLSGANLSRADLSWANLSEADLSGANLSRANLSGANLSRADLSGANLSEADLSGAKIDLFSSALARRSDPPTSHAAAAKVIVNEIAARCLDVIRASREGLTATEISERTGIERDTVSPRLPELVRARLIRDSGRKRQPAGRNRKAIVWEAVL